MFQTFLKVAATMRFMQRHVADAVELRFARAGVEA